jgi:hypothetical protein
MTSLRVRARRALSQFCPCSHSKQVIAHCLSNDIGRRCSVEPCEQVERICVSSKKAGCDAFSGRFETGG